MRVLVPQGVNTHFFYCALTVYFFKPNVWRTGHRDQLNSPTPNPFPLERGVNTPAFCWRTGHGDPVLL